MLSLNAPVVGILRGISPGMFGNVMKASFDAGLEAIEITMNTPGAPGILEENRKHVSDGQWLGMGTIRNMSEARTAFDAGAMFFVTPNVDTQVIEFAVSRHIPIIAGALTPTEVYTAWHAGADMVKVFPAGVFGPKYIKDLHGPFDDVPLVAVGGVSITNVRDYLNAGAVAVGVGNILFGAQALKDGSFQEIGDHVQKFIEQCRLGK